MSQTDSNKHTALGGLFAGGLAAFVCLVVVSAVKWPGVDNDLTQVLTVARNIAAGNGIVTDTLYYTEHYATGKMPAPQTVFPPGQPAVVAALTKCGLDIMTAALVISAVGFVAISVCVYWLSLRAGASLEVSFVATILWLCVVLAWVNTIGRKSDIPFTALTMISACLLVRSDSKFIRNAILSGIAAAAALTFRYAGLFFMASVGLTLLMDWLLNRTRLRFSTLIAFCVPAGATCAMLFWRNYMLVGDIKGGNNYAIQKSSIDILRNMYRQLSSLIGLDYARLSSGGIAEWLLLLFGGMLVVWLFRSRKWLFSQHGLARRAVSAVCGNRALMLSVIYPIMTLIMMYVLETKSQPGSRDRMYLAAAPFLFCAVARFGTAVGRSSMDRLSRLTVGCGVVVMLLGQANVARERFDAIRHEHHIYFLDTALDRPMGDTRTLREFLLEHITHEHPLMVNEPQRVGELLHRPIVGLPSVLYTSEEWTADAVRDVVDRYGVEYIVCFTDTASLEYEEGMTFFKDLASDKVPAWLEQHFEDNVVRVFRVR